MIFKKMYGKILGHSTIGMTEIKKSHFIYRCPKCASRITYEKQCLVARKQKQYKKKIISEEDLLD